jgi:hypothetical protein
MQSKLDGHRPHAPAGASRWVTAKDSLRAFRDRTYAHRLRSAHGLFSDLLNGSIRGVDGKQLGEEWPLPVAKRRMVP